MNIDAALYPPVGTSTRAFKFSPGSSLELGIMTPRDSSNTTARLQISMVDLVNAQAAVRASTDAAWLALGIEVQCDEAVVISPRALLRSMWTLLVSSFTDPFSVTVIDVTTGEKVRQGH